MLMWCFGDYAFLLRFVLAFVALASPISAALESRDTDTDNNNNNNNNNNNCTLVATRKNYATEFNFSSPIAMNMTSDTQYSLNNCSLVQTRPRTRPAPLGSNTVNDQFGWLGVAVFFTSNQSTLFNVSIFVTGGTMLVHAQLSIVNEGDQISTAVATNSVTVQFTGVVQQISTTTTLLRAPLIIASGNTTQLQLRIVSCTLNIAFYDSASLTDCTVPRQRAALLEAETSNDISGVHAEITASEVRIVSSAGCTLFATIATDGDVGRLVNLYWSFWNSTVVVALPFALTPAQAFVYHSAANKSNIMTDIVNSSLFARDGGSFPQSSMFPLFNSSSLPNGWAADRCGWSGSFAFVAFDAPGGVSQLVVTANTTTRIRSGSRLYASFLCFDAPYQKDFFVLFEAPVPSIMSDHTFDTSTDNCTVVSSDVYAVQYAASNATEVIVRNAAVTVEGSSSMLLAGTHHAVGVLVKNFDIIANHKNLVDGFILVVQQASIVITAYGPLTAGAQSARIGSLLVMDRCTNVTGVVIMNLSYVDAFVFTQSGMDTDDAANNDDKLAVASASLLYIASAIYNTGYVRFSQCSLYGNVSGGIPPAYKYVKSGWILNVPLVGLISSITLIYVFKIFPVVGCLFVVRDSRVRAAAGYEALPTAFYNPYLAPQRFLSTTVQVSAMQLNAVALNSSVITVDNTTVVVLQHNFSMLGMRQPFLGNFTSFNTTSIVSVGDTSQVGLQLAAAFISMLPPASQDALKTKMVVKDTRIMICNSSASYASGLVLGAMDALQAVALPSIGVNFSIALQLSALPSVADDDNSGGHFVSYPSALFAPAGDATFSRCAFSVRRGTGTQPPAVIGRSPSTLQPSIGLLVMSGVVVLEDTILSFSNINFFPSSVNQPSLINISGAYKNVTFCTIIRGADSQVRVEGCTFNDTISLFQRGRTFWDNSSVKIVGCNRIVRSTTAPISYTNISFRYISAPRTVVDTSQATCFDYAGTGTRTASRSLTKPLEYLPLDKTVQEKLADASTGVIAGIGAAAALSAALLGPSGLMDAQALAAYGRSACAPPALKKASQGAQFLQAPFYALGDDIAVIANLVIVFLLSAVHFGAVQCLTRRRNRASSSTASLLAPPLKTAHNSSGQRSHPGATPDLLSIEVSSHSSSSHVVATTNEYLAPATFATGNKTQQFNAPHMPRLKKHLTADSLAMSRSSPKGNIRQQSVREISSHSSSSHVIATPNEYHVPVSLTPDSVATRSSPKGNIRQQSVRESLRFPMLSIAVGTAFLPGTVNIGTSLLFSGTVSGTICGVCVAIACGIGAYYLIRLCRWRYLLRYFVFEPYTPVEMYRLDDHMLSSTKGTGSKCASLLVANLPLSIFPIGRWTPQHLSAMYGPLRNSIRDGKESVTMYHAVIAALMSFVSGIPVPLTAAGGGSGQMYYCVGMWSVLAAIQIAVIVFLAFVRPARVPFSDVLTAISALITVALQVALLMATLNAPAASEVTSGVTVNPSASFEQATLAVSLLSIVTTLMAIVKTFHMITVRVWEHHMSAMILSSSSVRDVQRASASRLSAPVQSAGTSQGSTRRMSITGSNETKPRQGLLSDAFHLFIDVAGGAVVRESRSDQSRHRTTKGAAIRMPQVNEETLTNLEILIQLSCKNAKKVKKIIRSQ